MDSETIRRMIGQIAVKSREGYVIIRAQVRREISLKYNNGRIENIYTVSENGMGVQGFTQNGACGFASSNVIEEEAAEKLVQKALVLAAENERVGCELNKQIFSAEKNVAELTSIAEAVFDCISPEELQEKLSAIHKKVLKIKSEKVSIAWQTSYRQVEDFWCIGRTDGTLVSFFVPRAVVLHQGTVKKEGKGQSFSVQRSGIDARILSDETEDSQLHFQAENKADFIRKVCSAPQIPSGSYPLIIDHGLAKGLAHEAFGHAVESDLMEESVLSEKGKLRKGLVISGNGVDIIDESFQGDWAYQPYSANGEKRKTVEIVKDGILVEGLGDVFSAAKAGMDNTGAGRVEYYGSVPLPRMTNIRLIASNHIPLVQNGSQRDEIQTIRETLLDRGLLEKDTHFLLLGYRGGQVNSKTGDFVFQCDGAVNLADPALPVYQAGIFSGKILSVLEAVKASIGEERYNAIGTCGKAGQMVPSSGGGNGYILLEKNNHVKVGGSEVER